MNGWNIWDIPPFVMVSAMGTVAYLRNVDDPRGSLFEQVIHASQCVFAPPLRSETVTVLGKVPLKDRFQSRAQSNRIDAAEPVFFVNTGTGRAVDATNVLAQIALFGFSLGVWWLHALIVGGDCVTEECAGAMNEPVIQTVLGRIPSAELGVTLPHEHFFVTSATANLQAPVDTRDWELAKRPVSLEIRDWLEFNWHSNRDNLVLDDADTALDEAHRYRLAGGRSVIDVTPVGVGREPLGLAALSRKTGLHIVMGSGYYVATTHPAELATIQQSEITDRIVAEFADGVGDTGVRPGVIGEIGCSWPLVDVEEKVLRAAGVAQKILGAALYVHPGKHPDAPFQILKILESTGADICRIIICHIERTVQEVGRIADLLRSGCTTEYDLFGMETTGFYYRSLGIDMLSDAQRLNQLRELIAAGFIHQLIISHDICFKHRLHKYGGHGYDHILSNILPWMRQRGFSAAEIETIVTDNPRRLVERPART